MAAFRASLVLLIAVVLCVQFSLPASGVSQAGTDHGDVKGPKMSTNHQAHGAPADGTKPGMPKIAGSKLSNSTSHGVGGSKKSPVGSNSTLITPEAHPAGNKTDTKQRKHKKHPKHSLPHQGPKKSQNKDEHIRVARQCGCLFGR